MSKMRSTPEAEQSIRLNRFIAGSGVCTRREADALILEGRVKVNDVVVKQLGTKVDKRRDRVTLDGTTLSGRMPVYLLMNKGPGIPCHAGRGKDIFSLIGEVADGCQVLDPLPPEWRGLVVLATEQATNVRAEQRCTYHLRAIEEWGERIHASISEQLAREQVIEELGGLREDGSFGITLSKSSPGVLKSLLGKMMEGIEYVDRVTYGPLTKRDLPRGRWRMLDASELAALRIRH